MMKYVLRQADKSDVKHVFSLVEKRVHWMDCKGIRQWNVTGYLDKYPFSYYEMQQRNGRLYVLHNNQNRIIGAAVLFEEDDRWEDCADLKAFYVHNLVTDSSSSGVGKILLQKLEKTAKSHGKDYLRLDCAADNGFLNNYYEDLGYVLVGTCEDGAYIGNKREKKLNQ